ncbi:MAG: outer membrane lipid asymmetry maintenance protein MlaD [Alphaproteobacteria bacterium]|nr:outer membrane lipid asymmetry maintenance protein MlaD [Alphaproteobacteria bacterium]
MSRNAIETLMGGVVLVVTGFFLVYAYNRGNVETVEGYRVTARFTAIDGLRVGDDVKLSGIKIGSVVAHDLDPEYFQAVVTLSIDPNINLPDDSAALIASEGLLGGKYVAIEPGGAEETVPPGGEITMTQPAVNLESLIGKLIYNYGSGKSGAASSP